MSNLSLFLPALVLASLVSSVTALLILRFLSGFKERVILMLVALILMLVIPLVPAARYLGSSILETTPPLVATAVSSGATQAVDAMPRATSSPVQAGQTNSKASSSLSMEVPRTVSWLIQGGLWLWLLGIMIGFSLTIRQMVCMRRLRNRLEPVTHPGIQTLFDKAAKDIGLNKCAPLLLQGKAVVSPYCAGSFRPYIALPKGLETALTSREISMLLAHELTHIRNRDNLLIWGQLLACILHWWNPFLHRLVRTHTLTQEYLCDRAAIACGDAVSYARLLLRMVAGGHTARMLSPGPAFFTAKKTHIKSRMEKIVGKGLTAEASGQWNRARVIALTSFVVLLGASPFLVNLSHAARNVVNPANQEKDVTVQVIHGGKNATRIVDIHNIMTRENMEVIRDKELESAGIKLRFFRKAVKNPYGNGSAFEVGVIVFGEEAENALVKWTFLGRDGKVSILSKMSYGGPRLRYSGLLEQNQMLHTTLRLHLEVRDTEHQGNIGE